MRYVIDTCVFNWLLDGRIAPEDLPLDGDFVVTHLQYDEISKTSDAQRRAALLARVGEVQPEQVPTESAVWDVSRWDGGAKWDGAGLYEPLKNSLDARNGAKRSNAADALVGEVAIANGYTLLTADQDLAAVVNAAGGAVYLYRKGA